MDGGVQWAQFASVAFDGTGNATAVWQAHDGDRSNIWAARTTGAGAWGTPTLIETEDLGDAVSPQVAAGPSGQAFVVWRQSDGVRTNIWANVYQTSTGWGNATLVEHDDTGWAQSPRVAADAFGRAIAVWSQDVSNDSRVFASRYTPSGGWSPPVALDGSLSGQSVNPDIAMDPLGSAVAVWQVFDGVQTNISASRYTTSGGWTAAVTIETDDRGWAQNPRVVADPAGNALAVWQQSDGTRDHVVAARFSAQSGWMAPVQVESNATGSSSFPEGGLDASGNAVVVWQQPAGGRESAWASRGTPGGSWTEPVLLETDDTGDVAHPRLAVDRPGNAFVVWHQWDGARYNVHGTSYAPGVGWTAPALVDTGDAGSATDPTVAADNTGNAYAVWHQWDGARYAVRGALFVAPTAPGAPTALQATAGNGQVTLSWTAPADNGGSAISAYNVYRSPDGVNFTQVGSTGAAPGHVDTSLENGRAYSYRVTAVNGFRESAPSLAVTATPVGPPLAPSNLTATVEAGQVTLTWVAPAGDGGHALLGYSIYRGTDPLNLSLLSTVDTSTSFGDLAIVNGTTYHYAVAARNDLGEGPSTAVASATPTGAPPAPTGLSGQGSNGNATVAWHAPASDGGSALTGYTVYRSKGGGPFELAASLGPSLSFQDGNLSNGVEYTYRVASVNAYGEGARSAPFSLTPVGPPEAPTQVSVTASGDSLTVTWVEPASDGGLAVTGYTLYRRAGSGSMEPIGTVGAVTTYTDAGLGYGQTYYYQVTALNSAGEGARSALGSSTLGAPPDVSAPTLVVLAPTQAAETEGPRIEVRGTASDDVSVLRVEVSADGSLWLSAASTAAPTTGAVNWSILLNLSAGSQTVRVRATDAAGNVGYANASFTVTLPATTPPPDDQAPATSEGLPLELVLIAAVAAAGGGAGVVFLTGRSRRQRREHAEGPIPSRAAQAAAAAGAATGTAAAGLADRFTYLVEDIFLLHRDGRVIYTRSGIGADAVDDPESVGVMLVAVQDFIRDSFKKGDAVDKMSYGDSAVMLKRGNHVILAVTVFGKVEAGFQEQIEEMVHQVEGVYAGIIEEWDGNKNQLAGLEGILAPLWGPTKDLSRADVLLAVKVPEVQMVSGIEFYQGFVRLKVAVVNNTPSVITSVTIDVDRNQEVLRLHRIEPEGYRHEGTKVGIGVLNPGEKGTVAYFFDPQMCTESVIDGVCRYKDHQGQIHTITMKSRKAEVVCPLFFTREQANTAMLKRLVEEEIKQYDVKAFRIGAEAETGELKDLFGSVQSIISSHDVNLVRDFTKDDPYFAEAWYHGTTRKGFQVVIRALVDIHAQRVEFYVATESMRAVTGLLAELSHNFDRLARERFQRLEIEPYHDESVKGSYADREKVGRMIEGVAPS